MEVRWNDPDVVSLHRRLAACIQREYELSNPAGAKMDIGFGRRAALRVFNAATHVDVYGSSGEWTLSFLSEPETGSDGRPEL